MASKIKFSNQSRHFQTLECKS